MPYLIHFFCRQVLSDCRREFCVFCHQFVQGILSFEDISPVPKFPRIIELNQSAWLVVSAFRLLCNVERFLSRAGYFWLSNLINSWSSSSALSDYYAALPHFSDAQGLSNHRLGQLVVSFFQEFGISIHFFDASGVSNYRNEL
jgi:hypothetical protein